MCKRQSLYSNVDGDANVAMARFPNDPHAPPHSKLAPKFLSTGPGQKEITHSPRQQICFIKIQSENKKMIWSISFFIFCMICNFFKCDGFTVF